VTIVRKHSMPGSVAHVCATTGRRQLDGNGGLATRRRQRGGLQCRQQTRVTLASFNPQLAAPTERGFLLRDFEGQGRGGRFESRPLDRAQRGRASAQGAPLGPGERWLDPFSAGTRRTIASAVQPASERARPGRRLSVLGPDRRPRIGRPRPRLRG